MRSPLISTPSRNQCNRPPTVERCLQWAAYDQPITDAVTARDADYLGQRESMFAGETVTTLVEKMNQYQQP